MCLTVTMLSSVQYNDNNETHYNVSSDASDYDDELHDPDLLRIITILANNCMVQYCQYHHILITSSQTNLVYQKVLKVYNFV